MSGFKRVVLTERENSITQNVGQVNESAVQKQVNNFDNDYTNKRLNDLYNEFDSITINETDLNADTITKINAVSKSATPVKVKLYLTAGVIVALLLVFLAIYNIFVINNLNSGIKLLQADIAKQEVQLNDSVTRYEELTDTSGIQAELEANGYVSMDKVNVEIVDPVSQNTVSNYEIPTNWWDAFCNFIANIFGS